MASDQMVSARDVLDALTEVQRRGDERVMEELEQLEPDLASYVMETLSLINLRLMEMRGRPKETQAARACCRRNTPIGQHGGEVHRRTICHATLTKGTRPLQAQCFRRSRRRTRTRRTAGASVTLVSHFEPDGPARNRGRDSGGTVPSFFCFRVRSASRRR